MSEKSDPPQSTPPEPPLPSAWNVLATGGAAGDAAQTEWEGSEGGGWEPPNLKEVAQLFPGYEVLSLLGRGGMGAVYLARQTDLDRLVAIKLLPLEISGNEDFADRFRREAHAMARLNHPGIITVYDFGTTITGHLFFVMEYVEGANLADIIHEFGLNPAQALWIAEQVCTAVAYAHSKGIVHRDIKPANVMIDAESHVKVADFGLARLADANAEEHGRTGTGTVMGTPDYMAPEQMIGMNVDHRADIYSLGVMLYEMLCRQVPKGSFDLPSHRIRCDARIDRIVIKAIQQSPERRYQSTQEMKADVVTARTPVPVKLPLSAVADPSPPRLPLQQRVKPVRAIPPPAGKKSALPRFAGGAGGAAIIIAAVFCLRPKEKLGTAPIQVAGDSTPAPFAVPSSPGISSSPAPVPSIAENTAPAAAPKDQPSVNTLVPAAGERASPGTPKAELPALTSTPAPAATPKPLTDVEKWFAEVDGPQQEAFRIQVIKPFEAGVTDLRTRYLALLDAGIAKASTAGQLAEALAWRAERQAFEKAQNVAADTADTTDGIKALRAGFREQLAKLDQDRAAQAKARHVQYDAILAKNQLLLAQRQRLDDALLLQTKRDEIALAWLGLSTLINSATKDAPFVNTLGMKFVPVPGTKVLFSIWDTRAQDYAAYARVNKVDDSWTTQQYNGVPVGRELNHPVVGVNWDDAEAFCTWLTEKEIAEGKLPQGVKYRLPTDEEWSWAVGLPPELGTTPSEKAGAGKNSMEFPWGKDYPPRGKVGNYADEAFHTAFPSKKNETTNRVYNLWIDGYIDGYVTTSPVGSFPANKYGLYDMGGNVWQWCEDRFDPSQIDRALRGGSWFTGGRGGLLSPARVRLTPTIRGHSYGFRCVANLSPSTLTNVAASGSPESAKSAPSTPAPKNQPDPILPASASKDAPFVNTLGMRFVPVPILSGPSAGQRVLFSVWDTRVQDYAAYGMSWSRESDYPVVNVSWDDAQAFCAWLTEKELAEGKLPKGVKYRLPTDEEWSWAVGLPAELGAKPREKRGKNTVDFPWGKDYPPKGKVGNYADEAFHAKFPLKKSETANHMENEWIEGYTDGYVTISPVGSFPANKYGLYDMGGNVWQWCEDRFYPSQIERVLRGASWFTSGRAQLLSSSRLWAIPSSRVTYIGFRCVVGVSAR